MLGPQDSLPLLLPPFSEQPQTALVRGRLSQSGPPPPTTAPALPRRGRFQFLGAWKARPRRGPPPQHTFAQARSARRPHRGMSSSGYQRGSVQCVRGAPDPKVRGLEEGKTPDPGELVVPTRRSREQAGAGLWSVAKAMLGQTPKRDAVQEKEPRRARLALPSRRERAAKGCR